MVGKPDAQAEDGDQGGGRSGGSAHACGPGVVALGPIVASALAAALAEGGAIATLSAGGAVVAVGKAAVEVARRT